MVITEITSTQYLVGVTNSVADIYPKVRGRSKPVTFALTYLGTWYTLVNSVGMPKDLAQQSERNFKAMYHHSIAYIASKIEAAAKLGYVVGAFGLKLRTPVLHQTILGARSTPYAANKEEKTASNMITQSYGLLNSETLNKVMAEVHLTLDPGDVLPVASIHDSNYFYIRDDLDLLLKFNEMYIKHLSDYTLPELQHPTVKLHGDLEVYHPTWAQAMVMNNGATKAEAATLVSQHMEKYNI